MVRALYRLIPTSLQMSLVRVVGSGIVFLTQILLARVLEPSDLGIFYFLTSMATVAALVLGSGYPALLPRFITRYSQRNRLGHLAAFLRISQVETLKWSAAGAFVLAAAAWFAPGFDQTTRIAFVFGALTIIPIAIQRIQSSMAVNYRLFGSGYVPGFIVRPSLFALFIVGFVLAGRSTSVALLSALQFVSYAVMALVTMFMIRHLVLGPAAPVYNRRLIRRWKRDAWPLVIVSSFTWLLTDLAVILVAPFMSMADVAAFGICIRIAYLIGFTVQVAHEIVLPDLGDAIARRENHSLSAKIIGASLAPLGLTIAGVLLSAAFGEHLLGIFGDEFRTAKTTLVILMLAQFVRAVAGPGPLLLTLKGAQTANALICIASACVLLAADAVFATLLGDEGAAIALLVTTVFWLGASALMLYRMDGARADIAGFLLRRRPAASVR